MSILFKCLLNSFPYIFSSYVTCYHSAVRSKKHYHRYTIKSIYFHRLHAYINNMRPLIAFFLYGLQYALMIIPHANTKNLKATVISIFFI